MEKFLSKLGAKVKGLKLYVSAICLVCDDRPKTCIFNGYASLSVYDLPLLEQTNKTLRRIFGMSATLSIGVSDAIGASLFYNVLEKRELLGNTAYIYMGDSIMRAAFYPMLGSPAICDPEELLFDSNNTFKDMISDVANEALMSDLFSRTVNFMHCAFSPDAYIFEYDTVKFNDLFLRKTKRVFAILGKALPDIRSARKAPGFAALGAARMTAAELIKNHITSS